MRKLAKNTLYILHCLHFHNYSVVNFKATVSKRAVKLSLT